MIIKLTTIQIQLLVELGLLNDKDDRLVRFRIWESDMESGDASIEFFYPKETVVELEEMGIDIDLIDKMYEDGDCEIFSEISNDEFSDICQFDITIQDEDIIVVSGFYAKNQTTLF
jgi:hypothetical protein